MTKCQTFTVPKAVVTWGVGFLRGSLQLLRADCGQLSQLHALVMSHGQFKIGHGESIYTTEIGKLYNSGPSLPTLQACC